MERAVLVTIKTATMHQLIGTLQQTDILTLLRLLADAAWRIEEFETVDYILLCNETMELQIHPDRHSVSSFKIMGRFSGDDAQRPTQIAYFVRKLEATGLAYSIRLTDSQTLETQFHTHPNN